MAKPQLNCRNRTLSTNCLTKSSTDQEHRFTLPHRKDQLATTQRRLLSFLEPGIFAHNTLLPTQSLSRSTTLAAMSTATQRWATDPVVRKNLPSENLTPEEQTLIDGVIPQREEPRATHKPKKSGGRRKKRFQGGGYLAGAADGVEVQDFAIFFQRSSDDEKVEKEVIGSNTAAAAAAAAAAEASCAIEEEPAKESAIESAGAEESCAIEEDPEEKTDSTD